MKKSLILTIILAAVLLPACAEKVAPTLTITPNLSAVPWTGGSVDVAINTIFPWKVTKSDDVVATVSKENGVGEDIVTITVPETDKIETSSIKLTVNAKNGTGSVTKNAIITQEPKPFIGLDREKAAVSANGGRLSFVLTANGEWKSSCSTAGVTIEPKEDGVGRYTLDVIVPASSTTRTITISFTTAEGAAAELKIEQK